MKATIVLVQNFVLLLTLFKFSESADLFSKGHNVEALCKGQRVDLSTIEDLKMLVENLDESQDACSDHVTNALRALRDIVTDWSACTMAKASAITEFSNNYLRELTVDDNDTDEEGQVGSDKSRKLPKSLVKFAIAYGMQVSAVCKKHMMSDFLYAANAILRKRFQGRFIDFEHYLVRESALRSVLSPIIKTGEIILPSDLIQVFPGLESKLDEYFSDETTLDLLRELCVGTLQPLYEPALLPLAQLVRAGFNNKHFSYPLKMREHGRFWSFAVFMCETVKTIKTTDSETDESPQRESDAIATRKLDPHRVSFGLDLKLEPLKPYEPHEKADSKVLGRYDTSLNSLIKSFDANKNEVDRLQERIFKRSLSVFAMMSRKGDHKALLKKLVGSFRGTDKEVEEVRNGLINLVDAPESDSLPFLIAKFGKKVAVKAGIVALIVTVVILYGMSLMLKQGPLKAIHRSLKNSLGKLFSELVA